MDKAAHQTSKLSFKLLSPLGQTSVGQAMTPTLSLSSVDISTSDVCLWALFYVGSL